jgi:hypothetical protein
MTNHRRPAVWVAASVALYLVVATTVLRLQGRDLGDALLMALVHCAMWSVVVVVGVRLSARKARAAIAQGYIDVFVRSPDGQPLLSRRWCRAEVRPSGGALRITPLVGPSVAPFTVDAGRVEEFEDPRRFRDVVTGPIGDNTFLRIAEDEGTIEIAVRTEHVSWLMEAVGPDGSP